MNLNPLTKFLPSDEDRANSSEAYRRLYDETRRLIGLEVENARLLLTEKLTLLFGRVTLVAVCFVLAVCVIIFLSMSISDLLLERLTPWATYLIVAGFYGVLVTVAALFRRQLIIDPIARYISKVLLDPKPLHGAKHQSETRNAEGE